MKKETKFKKGQSGNPNGRPKGTPNKTTIETKEAIKTIIDAEFEQLDIYLEQLTARERLDFITKLLPYVLPKQNQIDHTTKGESIANSEPDLSHLTIDELMLLDKLLSKTEYNFN